jgi:hypothetical protein
MTATVALIASGRRFMVTSESFRINIDTPARFSPSPN